MKNRAYTSIILQLWTSIFIIDIWTLDRLTFT